MADIFLSYARADQAKVAELAAWLEKEGYSLWWDQHIDGGSEFSKDIERELGAAQAAIVAWSAAGAESRWVRDEAGIALEAGKLIAISLDGAEPPIGFKQIHAIDMTRPQGRSDLQRALSRKLEGAVEPSASVPQAAKSKSTIAIIVAAIALILAAGGWWFFDSAESDEATEQLAIKNTVAVLPFRSLSSDEDNRYFAEGVTEEILTRLGALDELLVTARSSSSQFAGSDLALSVIADRLGVSHIIEGSVRRSGDSWRVSAQLVKAADATQLWSDTYDVTGDDILAVQSEIAERAAEALGVVLNDEDRARMASVGIDNPEAYAVFNRGFDLFVKAHNQGATFDNLAPANEKFDEAFALEPRLWNARVASVDRYSHLLTDHSIGFPVGGDDVVSEALLEIQNRLADAKENAPRSAYPLIDQQALQYSANWNGAETTVRRMLANEQGCNFTRSYEDWLVLRLGLVEEYLDFAKRQRACDPLSDPSLSVVMLAYAGRPDEGIKLAEEIAQPSEALMRSHVIALLAADRIADAKLVQGRMAPSAYYAGQALTFIAAAEGDMAALKQQYALYESINAPDAAFLQIASLMGDRELANYWAARIDARPAGYIWLGNGLSVTCHCGNGFDLSATPNYRARLIEAGASLDMPSPVNWPLQK